MKEVEDGFEYATMDDVGVVVDDLREKFCGDVVPLETREKIVEVEPPIKDSKTGKILFEAVTKVELQEVPKNLTKCPQLKLTTPKQEEVLVDLEEVKEELDVEPITREPVKGDLQSISEKEI